jgi:hypothetical protein
LKDILSTKLYFPEHPQRSDKIKDLMSKMLKVKEKERIQWK